MRSPRIPSLLLGVVFAAVGCAYLFDVGPPGTTVLIILMVSLGTAGLLTLILRDTPAEVTVILGDSSVEGETPPESTQPSDAGAPEA